MKSEPGVSVKKSPYIKPENKKQRRWREYNEKLALEKKSVNNPKKKGSVFKKPKAVKAPKKQVKKQIPVTEPKKRIQRPKSYKLFLYENFMRRLQRYKSFKGFQKHCTIKLGSNNVFCTLKNIQKNTVYCSRSSGRYKYKITKKTLKYIAPLVISSFLEESRKDLYKSSLILNLIAPKRLRRYNIRALGRMLIKKYRVKHLIFSVKDKKCFNGCRLPKLRRKKKKFLDKVK
jgi:ribosomal protein S11